ncbi:hypothetical protein BKA70DRAFT_1515405 [Coprinopsis sp. MPI-PUGE-AT-0042]|nr:hypothetical protein BKA70DRAFT_1515405 [Coprinopsis sp. MPI-PUGE-AT-0042]
MQSSTPSPLASGGSTADMTSTEPGSTTGDPGNTTSNLPAPKLKIHWPNPLEKLNVPPPTDPASVVPLVEYDPKNAPPAPPTAEKGKHIATGDSGNWESPNESIAHTARQICLVEYISEHGDSVQNRADKAVFKEHWAKVQKNQINKKKYDTALRKARKAQKSAAASSYCCHYTCPYGPDAPRNPQIVPVLPPEFPRYRTSVILGIFLGISEGQSLADPRKSQNLTDSDRVRQKVAEISGFADKPRESPGSPEAGSTGANALYVRNDGASWDGFETTRISALSIMFGVSANDEYTSWALDTQTLARNQPSYASDRADADSVGGPGLVEWTAWCKFEKETEKMKEVCLLLVVNTFNGSLTLLLSKEIGRDLWAIWAQLRPEHSGASSYSSGELARHPGSRHEVHARKCGKGERRGSCNNLHRLRRSKRWYNIISYRTPASADRCPCAQDPMWVVPEPSAAPVRGQSYGGSPGTVAMFHSAHNLKFEGSTLSVAGRDVVHIHNHNIHYHYQRPQDIWGILQSISNFQKFRIWLEPNGNIKIFWGSGISGAGKTLLVSIVIQYLEALYPGPDSDICICYVYFHYSDHSEMTVRAILEILVMQTLERHSGCQALIEETYARHLCERTEPTEEQLLALLRRLADSMLVTFYVLNALDEAPTKVQLTVMRALASLDVKLFITSRPLKTVEANFPQVHTFPIIAQDADIDLHIIKGIDENAELRCLLQADPSLREEIFSVIKRNCSGMFLHASLQLDALHECINAHQVRQRLKGFPSKIEDVYSGGQK